MTCISLMALAGYLASSITDDTLEVEKRICLLEGDIITCMEPVEDDGSSNEHWEQKVRPKCAQFIDENGEVNKDLLIAMHNQLDKNNDTALDLDEYYSWMASHVKVETQRIESVYFCGNDYDSDGKVSLKEFLTSLENMDSDGDGNISQEDCVEYELKNYLRALAEERLMTECFTKTGHRIDAGCNTDHVEKDCKLYRDCLRICNKINHD